MKEEKNIRKKWLHIRLNDAEYMELNRLFAKATERKLGTYARKVLLEKPVALTYRNESLDQVLEVLVCMQNDLNGACNNYNQMVHRLHMLDRVAEFREWIALYEKEKAILFAGIEKIREYLAENAGKWLQ